MRNTRRSSNRCLHNTNNGGRKAAVLHTKIKIVQITLKCPTECHPERMPRSGRVEVLHSGVVFRNKLRNGNGTEQNRERDEWKRGAGSAMGFPNVCLAFELFPTCGNSLLAYPFPLKSKCNFCGRRVRNRLQIPLRRNTGDSPRYRALRFCCTSFRSSLRNIRSAKLRLGRSLCDLPRSG